MMGFNMPYELFHKGSEHDVASYETTASECMPYCLQCRGDDAYCREFICKQELSSQCLNCRHSKSVHYIPEQKVNSGSQKDCTIL